ncbi:MAG: hypothetical protein ACSLFB_12455 [Acidimicrobiales bacterium]
MEDQARRRRRLIMLLVPIGILVIGAQIGQAFVAKLAVEHPLLLIALDPRNRHMILASGRLDTISYFLVGTGRLLLSDPLFYLLGFWYGETAISWMNRRGGSIGQALKQAEWAFSKAMYPMLFVLPNNYICLFAGAQRMSPATFLSINIAGTITRLILIRQIGSVLEEPLKDLLGFFKEYQLQLTILGVSAIGLQIAYDRFRGTGEIEALAELEHEIEALEDEAHEDEMLQGKATAESDSD